MESYFGFNSNNSNSAFIIFINNKYLNKFTIFYEYIFKNTIDDEKDVEKIIFGAKLYNIIKNNFTQYDDIKEKISDIINEDIFVDNFLLYHKIFKDKSLEEIVNFLSNIKPIKDNNITKENLEKIIYEREYTSIIDIFYDIFDELIENSVLRTQLIDSSNIEVTEQIYYDLFNNYQAYPIDDIPDYELYEIKRLLNSYDKIIN